MGLEGIWHVSRPCKLLSGQLNVQLKICQGGGSKLKLSKQSFLNFSAKSHRIVRRKKCRYDEKEQLIFWKK